MDNISEHWSDAKCREIAFKEDFPSRVRHKDVQKNIITRFLNFYLGGKRQKGINVTDLVFSTIAIMPMNENNETFIWESVHFTNDGKLFFLTPEDSLKHEILNIGIGQKQRDENEATETDKNNDDVQHNANTIDMEVEESTSIDVEEPLQSKTNMENAKRNDKKHSEIDETRLSRLVTENIQQNVVSNDMKESMPSSSKENNQQYTSVPEFDQNTKWFTDKRARTDVENVRLEYGPKENTAFIWSCNKLLEQWDDNAKARIILKYFFGIVALVLMRATTKKYMHLIHTFAGSRFLNTIDFVSGYLKYSIPHKRCIKCCYRTFSKRDGNITIMFAKLVINSRYIDTLRKLNELVLNIFKVTVLAHTADYGLGIISILQKVETLVGNLKLVAQATFCADTAVSWYRVKNFLEKYMNRRDSTHPWARIINGEFKNLCCSSNYALSIILAVFVEKVSGTSDIWQSAWVENENKELFKKMALTMYEKYEKIKHKRPEYEFDDTSMLTPESEYDNINNLALGEYEDYNLGEYEGYDLGEHELDFGL